MYELIHVCTCTYHYNTCSELQQDPKTHSNESYSLVGLKNDGRQISQVTRIHVNKCYSRSLVGQGSQQSTGGVNAVDHEYAEADLQSYCNVSNDSLQERHYTRPFTKAPKTH